MVSFGIPSAAIANVLGGAGIGFTFATERISQNSRSGLMLFFNHPLKGGDWSSANNLKKNEQNRLTLHT